MEEIIKHFFDFELSLSNEELEYWDIFRHDLFMIVVYGENNKPLGSIVKKNFIYYVKLFFQIILAIVKLPFIMIFNKNKRILFKCSRYKIGNSFIDVNMQDIEKSFKNKLFTIETYWNIDYIKLLYLKMHRKKNALSAGNVFSDTFVRKINNEFNISLQKKFYQERITDFLGETCYYRNLYKILKPRSIFFIQNGIHKGMIKAAKELQIPIVELQHGEFGVTHPAYFYPVGFDKKHIVAADYLFVWSDFWKNRINFPGVKIITMGNSYYFIKKEERENTKKYDFSIISNTLHTPIFDDFLENLFETGYNGKICYKLHPQQKNEYESIKERWAERKNVDVILFEKNAIDIIKESSAIFAIHSTVVFQALDMNCKVILYKAIEEYLSHKDIFSFPNVFVIRTIEEFINALEKPLNDITTRIYENFNNEKYNQFLLETGI